MAQEQIRKKQILVVEDEPVVGRACQRVLKPEGFEVDIAADGLVAMKMVDEKSYDVCLSDIKLPLMNGIEFYYHLEKEHPALAEKFIFTSGDIFSGNTSQFLEKVKRPFLAKPFTPDELIKVIRDICGSTETDRDSPSL